MDVIEREVPNWHEYFFNLINILKSRSKDPNTQVGCVIVGKNKEILSTGYNSFPSKVIDRVSDKTKNRFDRPIKYFFIEHAERNAIYLAAKNGAKLEGSTIYIDFYPCCDCTRAIIQSGIKSVIINGKDYNESLKYWNERWKEQMIYSLTMLEEAQVTLNIYRNNKLETYYGNYLKLLEEK